MFYFASLICPKLDGLIDIFSETKIQVIQQTGIKIYLIAKLMCGWVDVDYYEVYYTGL